MIYVIVALAAVAGALSVLLYRARKVLGEAAAISVAVADIYTERLKAVLTEQQTRAEQVRTKLAEQRARLAKEPDVAKKSLDDVLARARSLRK